MTGGRWEGEMGGGSGGHQRRMQENLAGGGIMHGFTKHHRLTCSKSTINRYIKL